MKKLISALLVCACLSSYSQDDKKEVSDAVMDYVDAFYYGDSSKIVRSIAPDVVKYGYWRHKDSANYQGMSMSYTQMYEYAANVKKRNNPAAADKHVKKVEVLDVQDQTASAKLTAWWGTDYILLAKKDGKWMITHVLWQSPPKK